MLICQGSARFENFGTESWLSNVSTSNISKLSTLKNNRRLSWEGTIPTTNRRRSNSTLIKIVLPTYGGRGETLMTIGYNPIITTINRKHWCYNASHATSLRLFLPSYPSFPHRIEHSYRYIFIFENISKTCKFFIHVLSLIYNDFK